jgi:hypothetical protein
MSSFNKSIVTATTPLRKENILDFVPPKIYNFDGKNRNMLDICLFEDAYTEILVEAF